jgi:hypothetical protein
VTRRFSSNELSFLRNRLPVDCVIENLLKLPTRRNHDKLSFACPVCSGFDTSINTAHNLARCFACRQNFNPIELVMHHLQIGFVDSVKWLKKRMSAAPTQNKTTRSGNKCQPTSVGDILANMMPKSSHARLDSSQSILQRLSDLEHRVSHLYCLFDGLKSSLDQ